MNRPPQSANQPIGIVFVLFAAVAWSTAGLFTRVVSTDIPTTLFWRSFVGGICVLLLYMALQPRARRGNYFRFQLGEFVIGGLSTAGMICFISAFFYTSIANVSFVYGIMPLVTFLLAMVFLKQKADIVTVGACLLSAAGVALIMWGAQKFDDIFGILLAFGMTFFMAALTIATKYFPRADTTKATYLSAFLGALVMLPLATFGATSAHDYFYLALYGIMNVGMGFGVYLLGVSRVTAVAAALIGLLEIPIAPILAWWLFTEIVTWRTLFGGVIILSATVMYLLWQHRRGLL